jgi:hypothetical protein
VIMTWLRLRTATSNSFPHPYIKSVWADWYAVHWHLAAALHSFTHPTWLRFWGSGSLVESKWCDYVKVKVVDSHLKALSTFVLDISKVFEYIGMLYIGIHQQPYTVLSTLLGSDFGVLGYFWSRNEVIT